MEFEGFNCGEAVNFANDEWFLLGAAASRRYALLRMMPLIPYEELLCKEAMFAYKSSRVRSSKNKSEDTASYKAIVQPCLHLMKFYATSLLRLKKSSRNLPSYSNTSDLLICRICHRDCYVAYLLCKYCFSHPICVFHDIALHTCVCGRYYSIFKRNDILELEEAAKSFQQKKECCNETFSGSSLFSNNINECIKHLEDNPWQQEKSVRGTANSQGAASKPKTQVADCIKHSVENKTRMLHWKNNLLPSEKGTNRPEIIYNL